MTTAVELFTREQEPGTGLTRRGIPMPALATQREARLYLGIGAAEWSMLPRALREEVTNDYADASGLRRMRLSWGDYGWEEIPEDQQALMPPWQLGVPQ